MAMKKIFMMAAAVTLLLLTGCKNTEIADSEELLKSVPSSASMVTVVNMNAVLEKAGCKVDDGKVTPSDDIRKAIEACSDKKEEGRMMNLFFNNESGIDPSVTIFFTDGYATYNSGRLLSTDKFINAVEKEYGEKFEENEGIKTCRNVAIKDNRYWVVINGKSSVDSSDIRRYLSLSESQSFLSTEFATPLRTIKQDAEGWVDISGLMNVANISFEKRAQVKVLVESCFKDAGFLTYGVNFDKGSADLTMKVLDSKGKSAKYLLPGEAIDLTLVEGLAGKAESVTAVGVPKKLMKQISEQLSSQPLLKIYAEALSSIDGTVAVAMSDKSLSAVVQTNGENNSDIMQLLGSFGNVSKEGNDIFIKKGDVTGTIEVKELTAAFKGAYMGFAMTGAGAKCDGINSVSLVLTPGDGSVVLKAKATSNDTDTNTLQTLVREGCKQCNAKQ